MGDLSRREFIYQSTLAAAGISFLGCGSGGATIDPAMLTQNENRLPYLDTLGIQLWTVRNEMEADPAATLRAIADIGYTQVELMDTRHLTRLRPICNDLGLKINSSFMQWTTLTGRWDLVPEEKEKFTFEEVIEQAVKGGLSHLVYGYLQPGERRTADDWKQRAAELNAAGEKCRAAGLQLAYHNHNFEWAPVDGTTGFDILLQELDGDLVPFELDVAWAAMAGQNVNSVLHTIRDRIRLLHLKDLKSLDQSYLTLETQPANTFTELGNGQLDIPALLVRARDLGVDYCFYEQDDNWQPDALGSARTSYAYLVA